MNRSTELLKRGMSSDVETALEVIAEALMISSYSEKLLEMKAEALFMVCSSFSDTEKFYFEKIEIY
jgi:DnaJ family protein C protein 7